VPYRGIVWEKPLREPRRRARAKRRLQSPSLETDSHSTMRTASTFHSSSRTFASRRPSAPCLRPAAQAGPRGPGPRRRAAFRRAQAAALAPPPPRGLLAPLRDKTLVAWVRLASTTSSSSASPSRLGPRAGSLSCAPAAPSAT
jgi:hypothetical protein